MSSSLRHNMNMERKWKFVSGPSLRYNVNTSLSNHIRQNNKHTHKLLLTLAAMAAASTSESGNSVGRFVNDE